MFQEIKVNGTMLPRPDSDLDFKSEKLKTEYETEAGTTQVSVRRESKLSVSGTWTLTGAWAALFRTWAGMDTVTVILVVAAAFSLLVAGIGIMNIMLVSVTERTKEIGLRMAVGATGPVISLQFLIESVLISVTGGLIGVIVGVGASQFVSSFGMPSSVPAWSIYVSFLVCVFIGVLFGYIPAQKAANMDPSEAIRHE